MTTYNSDQVIFHIGMPKAASTTLQKNFFSRLPFAESVSSGDNTTISESLNRIIYQPEIYYNQEKEKQIASSQLSEDKPTIFSHEGASGVVAPLNITNTQSRYTIAKRIKFLYPKAKILIIIRNQEDFLKSFFAQIYKSSTLHFSTLGLSMEKYIDLNINLYKDGIQNIFQIPDYENLIRLYQNLFDDVKVVIFEEMVKDMNQFIKNDLSSFMRLNGDKTIKYFINLKENPRHTPSSIFMEKYITYLLDILNKIGSPQKIISEKYRNTFMYKLRQSSKKIHFKDNKMDFTFTQKEFINDLYSGNNLRVSEMLNTDLSQYGYSV